MPLGDDVKGLYGAGWRLITRPRILLRAGGTFGPERTAYVCRACGGVVGLRRTLFHYRPDGTLCTAERCGLREEDYRTLQLNPETLIVPGKYHGDAKCEACGVPDCRVVTRGPGCSWKLGDHWYSDIGLPPWEWRRIRTVTIYLAVAHLDHEPLHNSDDNLGAWCQCCHFAYDKEHHRDVRCLHKDADRPLLQEVA